MYGLHRTKANWTDCLVQPATYDKVLPLGYWREGIFASLPLARVGLMNLQLILLDTPPLSNRHL